jgi:hypothetical protein
LTGLAGSGALCIGGKVASGRGGAGTEGRDEEEVEVGSSLAGTRSKAGREGREGWAGAAFDVEGLAGTT